MPRPRVQIKNLKIKKTPEIKKGVRKKSKVVDHTCHRTYVVTQQIHMSDRYGYVEEGVMLFGKDEDMNTMIPNTYGSFLRTKNFIAVPKGRGQNIRKTFTNMKDFKVYLKEIEGIILSG